MTPFESLARLRGLLAVGAQHHVHPDNHASVIKGGKPLNFFQVLGLGLEQVLKYLLAVGVAEGSCSYVVFGGVTHPGATEDGMIGVPISLASQKFLQGVGKQVLQYCHHLGFHILGVDVPFSSDARKSHDLVGTLMEGSAFGATGAATMEVFMTSLPGSHRSVVDKKQKTADNLADAGPTWQAHLMLMIAVSLEGAGLAVTGWSVYRLMAGEWQEILQGVHVPQGFRLHQLHLEFQSIMDYMGKPYNTRGAYGPEFLLRKFLDHPQVQISTDTSRFAQGALAMSCLYACFSSLQGHGLL